MKFKWDVCAKMAANFLAAEEEEEISSSLQPTKGMKERGSWWGSGGVDEFTSPTLKALQSTAFKSGMNVISAAVLHGPLTGRLIGRLPFAPN